MDDGIPPYKFLQTFIGKRIKVELKDSDCYEGELTDLEISKHNGVGNILLRYVKRSGHKEESEWGLLRGNNILFIYL